MLRCCLLLLLTMARQGYAGTYDATFDCSVPALI
jgi:hypothetical protein